MTPTERKAPFAAICHDDPRANSHLIAKARRVEELEAALRDASASLAAALSILQRANSKQRQPKKVVASDMMFATMIMDCQKSLDRARAALKENTDATSD